MSALPSSRNNQRAQQQKQVVSKAAAPELVVRPAEVSVQRVCWSMVRTGASDVSSPPADPAAGAADVKDAAEQHAPAAATADAADADTAASTMRLFQRDPQLRPFTNPDFDPSAHTSNVIAAGTVDPTLALIQRGVERVGRDLRQQVVQQHRGLLRQVDSIQQLDEVLGVVRTGVDGLQASVARINAHVSGPFREIRQRTLQLQHVQQVSQTLRLTLRFVFLTRKLRSQLQGRTRELAKAAGTLYDVLQLLQMPELTGVDAVDAERAWINESREEVLAESERLLTRGIQSSNQADVGAAMQVAFNLHCLPDHVGAVVARLIGSMSSKWEAALHAESLGVPSSASKSVQTQRSAAWRAAMWSRVDAAFDYTLACCTQAWQLQRVLAKKKDPVSRVRFLDVLQQVGDASIPESFWRSVASVLSDSIQAATRNSLLEGMLVADYPRLVRRVSQFISSVQASTAVDAAEIGLLKPFPDQALLHSSLSRLETTFLARTMARMFDPVNSMFPQGSSRAPPGNADVGAFLRLLQAELEAASVDSALCVQVARAVRKAIQLFASKCESRAAAAARADERGGGSGSAGGQGSGLAFSNALWHLHSLLMPVKASVAPPAAAALLEAAASSICSAGDAVITPLFAAFAQHIEQAMLAMHDHDGEAYGRVAEKAAASAAAGDSPASPFVTRLQQDIVSFQRMQLSRFSPASWFEQHVTALADRVLVLFVRHAVLVRSISEVGRMRLLADMTHIELAVAPLRPVEKLGSSYRTLRALRPLLFMDTASITAPDLPSEIKALPITAVLHHLFSRAPPQLVSPYSRPGWNVMQYASWLDGRSDAEVWAVIKACLDSYAQQVSASGATQFAPVYIVMLNLGQAMQAAAVR